MMRDNPGWKRSWRDKPRITPPLSPQGDSEVTARALTLARVELTRSLHPVPQTA
jgi:hypothetical protein